MSPSKEAGGNSDVAVRISTDGPVIMVDDNPGDITLARLGFDDAGLENEWMSFADGRAFLGHMVTVRDGTAEMPSIVLLDLNMPQLSGFDVLTAVRQDDYFSDLPIFCMLTSSRHPRDRSAAMNLGASGFVVKPDGVDGYVRFFEGLIAPD